MGIAEDNLATDEDQAINQTQEHDNGNSEEIKIREQRQQRLFGEPKDGVRIRVGLHEQHWDPLTRSFPRNALYQEVYDWVGSMEKTPLYFTPHTQGSLMKHTDSVKGNSVVHVAERVLGGRRGRPVTQF